MGKLYRGIEPQRYNLLPNFLSSLSSFLHSEVPWAGLEVQPRHVIQPSWELHQELQNAICSSSSYITVKWDRASLTSSSPKSETGKILLQSVKHTEIRMGYLPSVLLPFLAQTCKSSMELLSTCPQLVSIQSSHISMRAMAPQWQALSCLVPLSLEPKTSRPNQTKIPKTYRKCLQRRHTILHLLLFYCFTCCWDSSIFIYTINSDWRGTLALMWSCIGVSTLFFHELFTGIQCGVSWNTVIISITAPENGNDISWFAF